MKEDGHYRLLDTGEEPNAIGLEMLERIEPGELKAAKHCWTGCAKICTWREATIRLADRVPAVLAQRAGSGRRPDEAGCRSDTGKQPRPTVTSGVPILEPARKSATLERDKQNIASWRWRTAYCCSRTLRTCRRRRPRC